MDPEQTRRISIAGLKDLAMKLLPKDHPLRQLLMVEDNSLGPEEFVSRIKVWIRLLDSK